MARWKSSFTAEVGVGVARGRGLAARIERFGEGALVVLRHAPGGAARARSLQLRHHVEHLEEASRLEHRHRRPLAAAHVHEAEEASWISASRIGVLETPKRSPSACSSMRLPGGKRPTAISSSIASRSWSERFSFIFNGLI
jgi:hypothetical protein